MWTIVKWVMAHKDHIYVLLSCNHDYSWAHSYTHSLNIIHVKFNHSKSIYYFFYPGYFCSLSNFCWHSFFLRSFTLFVRFSMKLFFWTSQRNQSSCDMLQRQAEEKFVISLKSFFVSKFIFEIDRVFILTMSSDLFFPIEKMHQRIHYLYLLHQWRKDRLTWLSWSLWTSYWSDTTTFSFNATFENVQIFSF